MSDEFSLRSTVQQQREHPALPPEEVAPHFPQLEILELLGRGGMGIVYKARQKGLDRLVALKLLPPDPDRDERFGERFTREARALATLQHPNIVAVHDSGQVGEIFYFIMEYVDGMNLRQMMDGGHLDPSAALRIVPPICDALQYAHDEGIMHRDVKPENILIDRNGRVKIADFGLAKLLVTGATDRLLTAPHQVMGTMHYMAPEQIEQPGNVDHRADIFALGVVLYEMLTGELPIGRFPLPSERTPLDPLVDQIVLHALEKEPDRRYQRMTDVKTDVEIVTGSGATPVSPPLSPVLAASRVGAVSTAYEPARTYAGFRSTGVAYLLWLLGFVGVCGIHRFYTGRWVTGIIWVCTGGLMFVGQLIDLLLIPGMIRISNLEAALLMQAGGTGER